MKIGLLVILVIFCIGCETDAEIELPEEPTKITINSFFNGESMIVVNLSKSAKSGRNVFEVIDNAEVSIYANKQKIADLSHQLDGNYSLPGVVCSSIGVTYSINVSTPGLPTAEASDILPAKPEVSSFISTPFINSDFLYKDFKMSVTLKDAEENNYYLLRAFLTSPSGRNIIDIQLTNSLGQFSTIGSRGTFLFNDKSFNGKMVDLNIDVSNLLVPNGPHSILLEIGNISKTYYDYQFSAKKQLGSDPLFGQEYIPISSNVTGGFGVFGAYNSQNFSFVVKQ